MDQAAFAAAFTLCSDSIRAFNSARSDFTAFQDFLIFIFLTWGGGWGLTRPRSNLLSGLPGLGGFGLDHGRGRVGDQRIPGRDQLGDLGVHRLD